METQPVNTEKSGLCAGIVKIISGVLILIGLYLTTLHSYLLFHSLAEIFSIVVACAVFILVWNSRRFLENDYLLFLGIAYLFVAGMDTVHTLAYQGMNVFEGYDTNLATQLWITARYMESISLLAAPFFLSRKLRVHYALYGYTLAAALFLAAIFYWHIFPPCFVEGTGLTPFKKVSEYIISFILLGAMALLFQRYERLDKNVFRLLVGSILLTICSELAFTFYVHAYGLSNLIGHYLKIVSFYLIYKAVIETGLVRPYDLLFRNLKKVLESLQESEGKLRDSEKRLKNAQHIAQLGFWEWELSTNRLYWSDETYRISGFSPQEFEPVYDDFLNLLHPEDRDIVLKAVDEALEGKAMYSIDHRIVCHNGGQRYIHSQGDVSRGRDGTPIRMVGTLLDITARKKAEESLRLKEKELRLLIDQTPAVIWTVDIDLRFKSSTGKGLGVFNLQPDQVVDKTLFEYFQTDDPDFKPIAMHRRALAGEPMRYDFKWKGYTFDSHIEPLYDEEGNINGVIGVALDVTDRKQVEDALRESEERFRALVESSSSHIFMLDLKGNYILSNEQVGHFGLEGSQSLIGRHLDNFYPPGVLEFYERKLREVLATCKAAEFEHFFPGPDGRYYHLDTLFPILRDGEVWAVGGICRDITERKQAEEALKRSNEELLKEHNQRMILSKNLIDLLEKNRRQIAMELHDHIGQTLTSLKMNLEMTHGKFKPDQRELRAQITVAQEKTIQAIKDVKNVSHGLWPATIDALGVVSSLRELFKEIQQQTDMEIHFFSRGIPERFEKGKELAIYRIAQEALSNIIRHAWSKNVFVNLVKKDETISLSVEDDGVSFDPDKEIKPSERMGPLGLLIMRERVVQLGGEFTIESQLGKGTHLLAEIPL